jgi:hypothetical protein
VALLFAEDGDQDIGDADFLATARLHMEHGTLQDALEPERRLDLAVLARLQARRARFDVRMQLGGETVGVCAAGAQHLADLRGLEDGVQQMLHGEELVPSGTRLMERLVDASFEFVRQHFPLLRSVPVLRSPRACTTADAGGCASIP